MTTCRSVSHGGVSGMTSLLEMSGGQCDRHSLASCILIHSPHVTWPRSSFHSFRLVHVTPCLIFLFHLRHVTLYMISLPFLMWPLWFLVYIHCMLVCACDFVLHSFSMWTSLICFHFKMSHVPLCWIFFFNRGIVWPHIVFSAPVYVSCDLMLDFLLQSMYHVTSSSIFCFNQCIMWSLVEFSVSAYVSCDLMLYFLLQYVSSCLTYFARLCCWILCGMWSHAEIPTVSICQDTSC